MINVLRRWKPPVARDAVFDDLKIGDLWNDKAQYIDTWYAIESIDKHTIIIGEPKSSQYNLSYLIIGEKGALLYDTGTGKRGDGVPRISQVVKRYTDKPVQVVLSHFHYDHTGGLRDFDGVTLIDLPHIRAKTKDGAYRVSALENAGTQRPLLQVMDWIKPNKHVDLGDREIQFVHTPGHTPESISLIDHRCKYAFTGDFAYQHLGGIVVFVPGSDPEKYIESIDMLVTMTGEAFRYFGAHGLPEYDHDWLKAVGTELKKIVHHEAKMPLSASTLAPLVPLRLHTKDQMLIYFPPFMNTKRITSWSFYISLVCIFLSVLFFIGKAFHLI